MTLLRLLNFANILEYQVKKINANFSYKTKYFSSMCEYEFWNFLII